MGRWRGWGGGGVIGVSPMKGNDTDEDWGWPTEGSSLMCGYPRNRRPVSLAMPDQLKMWHALAEQGSSKLMGKSFIYSSHPPGGGSPEEGGARGSRCEVGMGLPSQG
jgi:hypothetical protein